ncbi:hypothetical protein [Pseudomaricurvus sp.]|uniref:hypothetical protein n=1 Tax=Pseudomaricurvus sp. TaxID=2004510 RepID=UPI003F6C8F60
MTNTTGEEQFKDYTAKAGDVSRNLSLAGLALVWFFNNETLATPLTGSLKCAFFAFALSLATDFMQYFVGSLLWLKNINEQEAIKCKKTLFAIYGFIAFKLIFTLVGFSSLLLYLISKCYL